MGNIVVVIGAISVAYGVIDFLGFGDSDSDDFNWKKPAVEIAGGFAAVGIGYLMKYLGV